MSDSMHMEDDDAKRQAQQPDPDIEEADAGDPVKPKPSQESNDEDSGN